MKGDFTRDSFDSRQDFYRVLAQQGRLQVDADWNEQIAIVLRRLETLISDTFGPHGGPEYGSGFKVFARDDGSLAVTRGRYYVAGMLCENHGVSALHRSEHVAQEGGERRHYVCFLDVYERYVPAAADAAMAEVALGGFDTAGRSKVQWDIRLREIEGSQALGEQKGREPWDEAWERERHAVEDTEQRGALCARTQDGLGFTGAQSQLYRVEIHDSGVPDGGDHPATLKWSRENGSVAMRVTSIDGTRVTVMLVPNAAGVVGIGDWVEITTDVDREDARMKPNLLLVSQVDGDGATLTLATAPRAVDFTQNPILRRWDQKTGYDGEGLGGGGTVVLQEDAWLTLESGVQICFNHSASDDPHRYRGGDYWLIPARTATASIEWTATGSEPRAKPPHGVEHRYAPIAGLTFRRDVCDKIVDLRIVRQRLVPTVP